MSRSSVTSGATAQESSDFPVYLVHSKWTLSKIDKFLNEYGKPGFLRIVYDGEGNETSRSIAILDNDTYDALCKDGLYERQRGVDFVIAPFTLKDNNFPGEGRTKTLFVPVPKTLGSDDETVSTVVGNKLKHLAEWNVIPDKSWSVNIPLKSRETGGIRSGCFISFQRDVHIDCIAMVRILLTDTYWPEEPESSENERAIFRCFWARDRDRKERTEKAPFTEKKTKPTEKEIEEAKEAKKKEAIKFVAKQAQPGKRPQKKAPTIPLTKQPLMRKDHGGPDCCDGAHQYEDVGEHEYDDVHKDQDICRKRNIL